MLFPSLNISPWPICSSRHSCASHAGSRLSCDVSVLWLLQVQHAGLRDSCTADILTVEFLVRLVDWFFPDFNYTWLVEEIKNTTPKVLHIPPAARKLLDTISHILCATILLHPVNT